MRRLKGVIAAAALLTFAATGPAQLVTTIYIPDTSTTSGSPDPVLFNAPAGRIMFNYIRGEVGPDSVHRKIHEISFVPAVTGTFSATRLQVRFGRGFLFELDPCYANNTPCTTIVYDGPFTWNAVKDTWTAIGLQNSYMADGQSNVLVDIRWIGGTGSVPVRSETVPTLKGSRSFDITSADPFNSTCGTFARLVPRARLLINDAFTLDAYNHIHLNLTLPHLLWNCPPLARYQMATSFGQNSFLDFGGGSRLRMDFDQLFIISVFVPNPYFTGYAGLVTPGPSSPAGSWTAPNLPALLGVCVVHGCALFDRSTNALLGVTNTHASHFEP